MTEKVTVSVGENSPEEIAYRLLNIIAQSEKMTLAGMGTFPDRKWLLDTYAECLRAVRNPSSRAGMKIANDPDAISARVRRLPA